MTLPKSEKIWFDGKLVDWEKATVHVATHALHYGSSVFEGIRVYETDSGPAVFGLDPHIDRLYKSCKIFRMEIPYSPEEIRQAILDTVRANRHKACYIRPLVFRGFDNVALNPQTCPVQVAIFTFEWGHLLGAGAAEDGVDVGVSSWRRMAPGTFPAAAKVGGQYINSQLIVMEALEQGYAEGIALDASGHVSEGSGENIFVVADGLIRTPPMSASILLGVTRRCIMTLSRDLGYEVREEHIPREFLYMADELFMTGTAAEVTPICSVDGIAVGDGRPGPVTKSLQAEFYGITGGRIPDRHGWLTLVNSGK
jgi:branched-chain amino acid aminotransferase